MIALAPFAIALASLAAVAAWAFVRFRAAGLFRRLAMASFPFSQVAIVATLCAFAATSGARPSFSLAVSCVGVACAVADAALLRSVAIAGERELEEERARFLKEELVEQEGRLAGARAEACRAEELRRGFDARLREVERELRYGDPAAVVRSLGEAGGALGGSSRRYCAHPIVDAIVATKARALEDSGVTTSFRLDVPADLPFSDVDMCALFSNVLDNALHACQAIVPERRFVEVRARSASGLFALEARNARAEAAGEDAGAAVGWRVQGDAPAEAATVSKPRGRGMAEHGWGLAIVDDIARRYGGTVEVAAEPGLFRTTVVLPLGGGRLSRS